MNPTMLKSAAVVAGLVFGMASVRTLAGSAGDLLPKEALIRDAPSSGPVANAAFTPGMGAGSAPDLSGTLRIAQAPMRTLPALEKSTIGGRDVYAFPAIELQVLSSGGILIPLQRGELVCEAQPGNHPSYWCVIPQFGRVWKERTDDGWFRAAFPVMLVNDTENHAHQGLATFLYRGTEVTAVRFQFVQQTAPYLVKPHFVAWGSAHATLSPLSTIAAKDKLAAATSELSDRLPTRPWNELVSAMPPGALDGFGGPLHAEWIVMKALIRDGTIYYQASETPCGPYPYPLEMRFGVRSVMKSVGVPLALLHLAEVYGPYVLNLKIGDYVPGLDPKFGRVRFADAANMASGFGGTGTFRTRPNDINDGYLDGDYDGWYVAPSHAEKIAHIATHLHPYPWEPGTVMRYRDQDFYLLGVALNGFLKSVRGPGADIWDMLRQEVLEPIGIHRAPIVRTRELDGRRGLAWFNAGYYPTLDDLAKIAQLYQNRGRIGQQQLLNRELTDSVLAARNALAKSGDASVVPWSASDLTDPQPAYRMGFHFIPYVGERDHTLYYLPMMSGFGENEVVLYPTGDVSIRLAKAGEVSPGIDTGADGPPLTIRAVERLDPFGRRRPAQHSVP